MKDGANQTIEEGKFVIYTHQKTATLSLGFIVGTTKTGVKMMETWSYNGKPANKTSLRVVQVTDETAESMDKKFHDKMKAGDFSPTR